MNHRQSARADLAMDRYTHGDQHAFTAVYEAVAAPIFLYLKKHTRDAHLAEDLLQQTLFRMHRGSTTFARGSAVLPWAFTIARRLLVDERRRQSRNVLSRASALPLSIPSSAARSGPESVALAREVGHVIQAALERLPSSQREAFELMRLEGLSHEEAAERLGISVSALKFRAHRASVTLRAAVHAA